MHYTEGYAGKLNYFTFCKKEIYSHSETDRATVDPKLVTCPKCKKDKRFLIDWADNSTIYPDIKRRIFIESDILHTSEIHSTQRTVARLCATKRVKCVRRVFTEILDKAWHNLGATWEAIKKADEIYANSSLLPLCGGSYTGAPVIFNSMCEKAIAEKIFGKDVYILRQLKDIDWYMIQKETTLKAFTVNNLFMYDENYDIAKIDPLTIKFK